MLDITIHDFRPGRKTVLSTRHFSLRTVGFTTLHESSGNPLRTVITIRDKGSSKEITVCHPFGNRLCDALLKLTTLRMYDVKDP